MFARMRRKGNPHTLLVGLQIGTAAMENSMEVSQKLKMDISFDLAIVLLGIYPEKTNTIIHKDLCTPYSWQHNLQYPRYGSNLNAQQ
mgnify:CR=1 FL=1